MSQKIHFISIGGSAMHNLALALHNNGFNISGSDDEIFEPSASRLAAKGLLPEKMGWFPEKITSDLEAVILGMHAKANNPELLKAQELGIKVYSYPEFIYQQSINKQRIVIAGSHGKTTITSMILHVLKCLNKPFDYLVGAKLEGFETMVQLSDAPIIVIEGDEYLSSAIDRVPKFIHYQHHIGVISGISWDHINVFPQFEQYKEQFVKFVHLTARSGTLVFNTEDKEVMSIAQGNESDIEYVGYHSHEHKIENDITYLLDKENNKYPIQVFGNHNLQNISAALAVCNHLGIKQKDFYQAIQSFKGAANRLELLAKSDKKTIFKDFAHSPSKLKATTEATKKQFEGQKLMAILELHTFSSLNKSFLEEYKNTFNSPDEAIVYYNPSTIKHKNLEEISSEELVKAFERSDLKVFTNSSQLKEYILSQSTSFETILFMSSGNFDGINLSDFSKQIISL